MKLKDVINLVEDEIIQKRIYVNEYTIEEVEVNPYIDTKYLDYDVIVIKPYVSSGYRYVLIIIDGTKRN